MIRYALCCSKGHVFESWFRDSAGFDVQKKRGQIECPECGDIRIEKAIMAPAVPSRREAAAPAEMPAAEAPPQPMVLAGDKEREMRAMLRAFKAYVEANTEHVGPRFAEEARKIHLGEVENRAIRGEASPTEVKALLDDGIEVSPLPILPDERN